MKGRAAMRLGNWWSKGPRRLDVAVVAGVVVLGAAGAAAAMSGGGEGDPGAKAPCPAPATGDISSVQVTCSTVVADGKNSREQVIDLVSPGQVALTFRWC